MKVPISIMIVGIVLLLLSSGCSSQGPQLFNVMDTSPSIYDSSSGRSVTLKSTGVEERIKGNGYLSAYKKSMENGHLELLFKTSIPNPSYRQPRIKLYNILTDEIMNDKKSKTLDVYTFLDLQNSDTIQIYIYPSGELKHKLLRQSGLAEN